MQFVWAIALLVASYAITALTARRPAGPRPATEGDFDFPQSAEGTPQPVVFGDVWTGDWMVLWYGNFRVIPIRQRGGRAYGFVGPRRSETVGYEYGFDVHMGLSRAPIDEVTAIRVGNRELWDASSTALTTGAVPANISIQVNRGDLFGGREREGGIVGRLRIFFGAPDQVVPGDVKGRIGSLVSDWRGVSTVFFSGIVATNNPYPKPWAFRLRRALCGWDGDVWYPQKVRVRLTGEGGSSAFHNQIVAMNPAHILYECITNRTWGRGAPRVSINEVSFLDAANRLCDEGLGLCLTWSRQNTLDEFVSAVVNHIGAALYIDRQTGLWTLRLIRDDYNAASLATFSYDSGLLDIEEDESATRDGAINEVIVEYVDVVRRSKASVREQDPAGFATRGAIRSVTVQYPGIPTANLALRLAARDLRSQSTVLRRFKLRLDRRAWNIAPASVFKLSVPSRGITSMIVRVAKIDDDIFGSGAVTADVVQDVFGLPQTSFNAVAPDVWVPPPTTVDPAAVRLFEANWLDLSSLLDTAGLSQVEDDDSVVLGYATSPGSLAIDFRYETSSDGVNWTQVNVAPFAARATFQAALGHDTTSVTLVGDPPPSADDIPVGGIARITEPTIAGEEIVSVEAYDAATGVVTLKRGCGDTPPRAWTTAAECIFYVDSATSDNVEYPSGETVYGRAVARSYSAAATSAPETSIETTSRLGRPYAPGDVEVNGEPFWLDPETRSMPTYPLVLAWVHRNRLTQGGTPVGHFEPSILPEAGTTYTLRLFDNDSNTLIRTVTGISGATYTYDPAALGDTLPPVVRGELRAVRGGVESFLPVTFVVPGSGGFNRAFNQSFNGA